MSQTADPPRQLQYMNLDELTPAHRNPKRHATTHIRKSIERFGFVDPIELDDRTGRIVVGHGRLATIAAMRDEGTDPPQGIQIDKQGRWLVPVLRGWASRSDADAEAYLLANNQLTIASGWDEAELAPILEDLEKFDPALLDTTGFQDEQLSNLLSGYTSDGSELLTDSGNAEDSPESTQGEGELIEAAGVTVGEPDHTVKPGQVWQLGDRCHLVVACPHRQWQLWVPYLTDGVILLPYPSPHGAITKITNDPPIVLVQPDTYIAGWIVTKWVRVTDGTPVLVGGEQ